MDSRCPNGRRGGARRGQRLIEIAAPVMAFDLGRRIIMRLQVLYDNGCIRGIRRCLSIARSLRDPGLRRKGPLERRKTSSATPNTVLFRA